MTVDAERRFHNFIDTINRINTRVHDIEYVNDNGFFHTSGNEQIKNTMLYGERLGKVEIIDNSLCSGNG